MPIDVALSGRYPQNGTRDEDSRFESTLEERF
jgi:hypothetical protein